MLNILLSHCRCVILQRCSQLGGALLDLSTLLEYRNGENPSNVLECIKKLKRNLYRGNCIDSVHAHADWVYVQFA